jgi:hypothetical protein
MKNKKVLLMNPAISSYNLGDHIIFESTVKELSEVIEKSFIVETSTHLPISRFLRSTKSFDYKFVCGSNLLRGKMNRLFRQWDINLYSQMYINNSILVGVGWWQYGDKPNLYTKILYRKVLSKKFIHSVRDSYTENLLKSIGISNVINTSCPTMWSLTKEHCESIPKKKAETVVFTLTDYNRDFERDKKMIDILCNVYKNIYFWPQGMNDLEYYSQLKDKNSEINLLEPNLYSYDNVLDNHDIDYVGTRLHAGIRALQKKRRAIIIAIDNRAIEKQKDFNLTIINRDKIDYLKDKILSSFNTDIRIPVSNIDLWKKQFVEKVINKNED